MEGIEITDRAAARIQQIAERIGYATQSAFARAFRSVYELSPQEYREHGSIPLA